ncbi:oligosaccharide flippase family protein [Bradyrhizobium arachidis]|uniref:oligosaccharide flippase family protein n=1 Tax=Bradyrhizobium TaxID=374 RepID=UPI0021618F06|nr:MULTISPECIES: oligosaccharide flippase family protein [Bradyrhizobium]MDN4988572.1 oligosaccharide flippase family protein [Bradyrhizobium sp. WYCCWR 13022]UVO35199.1 oligosaccharide flippase family protein [Bradyrhizobium arachidis]
MSEWKPESAPVNRVARGGVAAFFVYGLGFGLTYCSQLVVARTVGVETYGTYAYVFAWMVVLAYLATLGFDVGLLRFVPAYEAERDWPLLRGVIQYAQRRAILVGGLVMLVGVLFVERFVPSTELRRTFLVGFALVPVLALVRIRCSAVRAFGGVVSALVPDRVVRDGTLIALVAVATLGVGWTINAPFVMVATLISSTFGLICAGFAMRNRRPRAIVGILPAYDAAAWRRAAIPLLILGATESLLNRTGVMLLGWITSTKDAGIYSLAFNIALVVTLPRIAMNTLFAPAISNLNTRGDRAGMQILITTISAWTFLAGLCIATLLFVLADPLLAWFGAGYEVGAPAIRILLIAQVLTASAGSQLYVMTMTGHERSAAVLLASCTIVNAGVSAVLISAFGLNGAAIGTAVSLVIWNAVMALFLWRRLDLLPGILAKLRSSLHKRSVLAGPERAC